MADVRSVPSSFSTQRKSNASSVLSPLCRTAAAFVELERIVVPRRGDRVTREAGDLSADPNTEHMTKALNSNEFPVVQEIFMSETAKFANVVLPGASFFEKSGTFTDGERRVQRVNEVIPPLAARRLILHGRPQNWK